MIRTLAFTLGQVIDFDVRPVQQAAPAPPRMTSQDFFRGMHSALNHSGPPDNSFQKGVLIVVAAVAVIALVVHLRQRWQTRRPPHSRARLARELTHGLKFPFATRPLLFWVGHTTGVGFTPLLLSSRLYDESVRAWASLPTLMPIRRWGLMRLRQLRQTLFPSEPG